MKDWIAPLSGRISSKFGNRLHPITKEKGRFHNGVDIVANTGSEVVAPQKGMVLNVFNHQFGGQTIWILHEKHETRYCHLHTVFVKIGQKVEQGEIIAHSWNTGRSSGPHLHFGIKDDKGNYIDPQTIFTF